VCEANHSPSFNAKVKNKCSYTSIAPYTFMMFAGQFYLILRIKLQSNLTVIRSRDSLVSGEHPGFFLAGRGADREAIYNLCFILKIMV
jgi:hypothetical protein